MKRLKKFNSYLKENSNDDLDVEEEQDEISFSEEEINLLEEQGLERSGDLRFSFPGMDNMLIEVSKNEHHEDGHIYYRVLIDGYMPGDQNNPIQLYRKRFKTLDYALRRLNNDIDVVMMQLVEVIRRLKRL